MSAGIDAKYQQLGGSKGLLGAPTGSEIELNTNDIPCPDPYKGIIRYYEHGVIFAYEGLGTFAVCDAVYGPVFDKWQSLKREGIDYGLPVRGNTSEIIGASDITGERYEYAMFVKGWVCSGSSCGAHGVHNDFCRKWRDNLSLLGYPVRTTRPTQDGKGRFSQFESGSIYKHPDTPVCIVPNGSIHNKWASLGGATGWVGYPITDEREVNPAGARACAFQGASIFSFPGIEAHEIHGWIRGKWQKLSSDTNLWLGVPLCDETPTPDGVGRYNHFQNGSIYWHPNIGAYEVHGNIRAKWAELGWERGWLGYPISDELQIREAPQVMNLDGWKHGAPAELSDKCAQWAIVKTRLSAAVSYFQNGSIICGGGKGLQEYRKGTEFYTRDEFPFDPHVSPNRAWALAFLGDGKRLVYEERTWGINLGWSNTASGNVFFERADGASDPLRYGEPIAVRIKDQGYLCYGSRDHGIDLVWSDSPKYEWRILGGNPRDLIDSTLPVSLYNETNQDYVIKGPRDIGIDLWYSTHPAQTWVDVVVPILVQAAQIGLMFV